MPAEITKLDVKKMANKCGVEIEVGKTYRSIDTRGANPNQSWCDIKQVGAEEYKVLGLEKMVVIGGEFDRETTYIAEVKSADGVHPNIDLLVPVPASSAPRPSQRSSPGPLRDLNDYKDKLKGN